MTWRFERDTKTDEMRVWDHTQDPTADDPVRVIQNDGSGFTAPDDVLDVMYDEALLAYQNSNGSVNDRALNILADAAFEQIEEFDP